MKEGWMNAVIPQNSPFIGYNDHSDWDFLSWKNYTIFSGFEPAGPAIPRTLVHSTIDRYAEFCDLNSRFYESTNVYFCPLRSWFTRQML